ncbi:MAG: glycosyltransferase family 4 protein [Acidobacteriota bacterium]
MNDQRISQLHLLWLTENYFPSRGGMAESCDRIVHSLRQAGVNIDVAHFSHRTTKLKIENKSNGRDVVCPLGDDAPHAMNLLWNFLAEQQTGYSHLVAFGGTTPLIAGSVYTAWSRVPLVTLIRGNDFDAAIFSVKRQDVLREALKKSAQVCVVSRDKAQKIRALFPEIQPIWIPNGIDLDEWELLPSHSARAAHWRSENVAAGRRVLGMFGHIKQKKGGLFFLETLLDSGLADKFHLLFVGELDAMVIEFLQTHESEIAHSIFPFVDRYELLPHYAVCDLVAIASFYDGLPNVLLEAAALAVPLLAAKVGGMADVLTDAENSLLFYPGDAHQCRAAIERAATVSDETLKQMGESARLLVQTRLTSEIERENYLRMFLETPGNLPAYDFADEENLVREG